VKRLILKEKHSRKVEIERGTLKEVKTYHYQDMSGEGRKNAGRGQGEKRP
jgi:hypothetical protein